MKIALQFAMPSELHALPGARELAPLETVSGVPIFEIAPDILACAGGVSKVNAAMAAELLCLRYGVDLILNAGVAGCFTDLPTGTLVVASEFVQHDVDTTAVGDPIGLVSTVNQVAFPTWQPERCAELLASLGYPAVTGRVSTGDWFAVKGQRAEWIRGTFSPLLTEMEGGAIAQVCLRNGVRFVSVKSVSDHLFSDSQAEEYFDFGQALEALGRAVLPLARPAPERGCTAPFPGFRWSPAGPPPALPAPPASGPDGPGAPSSGCGSRLQPPALPEAVPGGGQGVDHHRGSPANRAAGKECPLGGKTAQRQGPQHSGRHHQHPDHKRPGGGPGQLHFQHLVRLQKEVLEVHRKGEEAQESPRFRKHACEPQQGEKTQHSIQYLLFHKWPP